MLLSRRREEKLMKISIVIDARALGAQVSRSET
jgi:hypothetical protein